MEHPRSDDMKEATFLSEGVYSYLKNAGTFGGLAALFFTLLNVLVFGESLVASLISGVTFGVVYGGTMGIVYRSTSFTMPAGERKALFNRFTQVLEKMRFEPIVTEKDRLVFRYKPLVLKGLSSRREVSITINDGKATVKAPRVLMKQLQMRLKRG